MQRLAANPAVGASMAAAAARVVGGYDWAAVADRYIDLYREVVAGGLVPAAGRGGVAA
jgi:glycosyltransferase involved in cell wall biosynthesis